MTVIVRGRRRWLIRYRDTGVADGFALHVSPIPGQVETFVDEVIPILQRRGYFRTEYEGSTFRENLGLPYPD